jgi:hypothetical protein
VALSRCQRTENSVRSANLSIIILGDRGGQSRVRCKSLMPPQFYRVRTIQGSAGRYRFAPGCGHFT